MFGGTKISINIYQKDFKFAKNKLVSRSIEFKNENKTIFSKNDKKIEFRNEWLMRENMYLDNEALNVFEESSRTIHFLHFLLVEVGSGESKLSRQNEATRKRAGPFFSVIERFFWRYL